IAYDPVPGTASPRRVMRERKATCFEGALFAAAVLRRLGDPPLVVDMYAVDDDDHVIAVYRRAGRWGALGKSNFTTLRSREPVYHTLRELVMSYFDFYMNLYGDLSLRSYSRPVSLARFDHLRWMTTDEDLETIGDFLTNLNHAPVVASAHVRRLNRATPALLESSLLGADRSGLYVPRKK
ncbi:MAG: hypothetical protein OEW05_08000, partial [Candidatus Aminicenantes bacterium]|nr:hypothetical protein [Candidatus Aminicenantes bacterium]